MNSTDTYKSTYEAAQLADGCFDALEALVDKFGMPRVLDILAEVSIAKSAHLEENWQDDSAAKMWEHVCKRIQTAAVSVRAKMERYYGRMS